MSLHRDPETRLVRFKQILVVDQDETWARVLRDAVARGGYCVVLATSDLEAVRRIREQAPDLLLISCLLGDQTSETLLRELEGLKSAPPVVLVGLQDGDPRWELWKPRSFVTVIRQPFQSRHVLEVVRTLLDSSWEELPGESKPGPTSESA